MSHAPERSRWRQWFLVLAKPANERIAESHLERQGFEVYCPRLVHRDFNGRRWVERIGALFPRYLFVRLDTRQQTLAPIRSTRGVSSVVRFGEVATVVPDDVVESLKERADPATGLHRLEEPTPGAGSAIRIVRGAFAGLDAIFERRMGEERSLLLLSLLGTRTPVCIGNESWVAA